MIAFRIAWGVVATVVLPVAAVNAAVQPELADMDIEAIAQDIDLLVKPFDVAAFSSPSLPIPLDAQDAMAKLSADPLIVQVAEAVQDHPEARAALETGREAGYAVQAAAAGLYPTLDAGIDMLGSWTNRTPFGSRQQPIADQSLYRPDAYISAEQLLFDAGATYARIAAARYRQTSRIARGQVTATDVALRAAASYWDVLRLREAVKLARANLAAHAVLLERVRVRVEAGTASEGDRLRAEARTNAAQSQAFSAEGAMQRAEAEYRSVFGATPASLSWPALVPQIIGDPEAIVARAMNINPSIVAEDANVSAAREDVQTARAAALPRVSVVANARQYDLVSDDRLYDAGAQVVLRYNLFSGGRRSAEAGQAQSRLRQAELQRDAQRRELESDVRSALADVVMRERQFDASKRAAETSQQTYGVYVEQYGIGRRTLDDLLDALSEAYEASGQLLQARVNLDVTHYALAARTGDLLDLLGAASRE